MKDGDSVFRSETTSHEVFAIKQGHAFIGFKIPNGNFHFETIPYTEPNPTEGKLLGEEALNLLQDMYNEQLRRYKIYELEGWPYRRDEWVPKARVILEKKNKGCACTTSSNQKSS